MEYVSFEASRPLRNNENVKFGKDDGSTSLVSTILCCDCGKHIKSNTYNMCKNCLRLNINLVKDIPKDVQLIQCKSCKRFLQPPSEWITAPWESKKLLTLCLKKLKGVQQLGIIDACFIWTECHSKRIKVKLIVQAKDGDYEGLRQSTIIEYTIGHQMCMDCHRIKAKNYWRCIVQLRQHSENKKTFLCLEQLILKYQAHENALGIKPMNDGLDFYFDNEQHARKMVNFLEGTAPVKVTTSKQLVSHDKANNIYNYKLGWSVEIAPISKDSLVCLAPKLRNQLGNFPALCLVLEVAQHVHLIDPMSGQLAELNANNYFRAPFEAICNPRQLIEYTVIDIEFNTTEWERKSNQSTSSPDYKVCDIWLIRMDRLGRNEYMVHTRTHLGHYLNVGDVVLGYNLTEMNINYDEYEKLKNNEIPDVIVVRKNCKSKTKRGKVKRLTYNSSNKSVNSKNQNFLHDLKNYGEA